MIDSAMILKRIFKMVSLNILLSLKTSGARMEITAIYVYMCIQMISE